MPGKPVELVSPRLGTRVTVPAEQVEVYTRLGYRQARRPAGGQSDSSPRPRKRPKPSESE